MIKKLALRVARERQKKIYKKLFQTHKESFKSLHWSNKENQKIRFDILLEVGNITNKKILDIGSGMGDFFGYIDSKNIKAAMTGYEIVEEFVKISKNRYPKHSFEPIDLSKIDITEKFDFVFSSGIFAFGNKTFFETMIKKSFSICKIAYAFNFYNSTKDKRFMSISKTEIEKILTELKPSKIVQKSDYLENDTTFFIYK